MPDLLTDRKSKSGLKLLKKLQLIILCLIPLVLTTGYYIKKSINLPNLETLKQGQDFWRQGVKFQDRQGRWIYQWGGRRRIVKPLGHFPNHLILALLASEDQRFFNHFGLDPIGVLRALWLKVMYGGKLQGGSTITQQLAKAWVGNERTLERKLREAILALKLEWYFSKDQLLEDYFNQVYLGCGAYGFEEASFTYFGHSASSLSLAKSTLLAVLPPQPSKVNPVRTPQHIKYKRDHLINELLELEWISVKDAQQALQTPITSSALKPSLSDWAPDYLIEVKRQLQEAHLWKRLQGHSLTLAIDLPTQLAAIQAVTRGLNIIDDRQKRSVMEQVISTNTLKTTNTLSTLETQSLETALISVDLHHRQGQLPVLAALGSINYKHSHFHRVSRSCFPMASTIKPFIYGYALSKGYKWDQRISDAPISIYDQSKRRIWRPKSTRTRGHGVRMLDALAKSHNAPFIHLTEDMGLDHVRTWLEDFGFKNQPDNLTLALGSGCASPQQLSLAYAQIAQHHIRSMEAQWYILPEYISKPSAHQRYSPLNLWLNPSEINSAMLQSVSEDYNSPANSLKSTVLQQVDGALSTVVKFGTAQLAKHQQFEVRGKTGTHENTDTWFVGYRPERLTTIWVGSDQRNHKLSSKETGSMTALPIWLDFSQNSAQGLQKKFPPLLSHTLSPKVSHPPTLHPSIPQRVLPNQLGRDYTDSDRLEVPF